MKNGKKLCLFLLCTLLLTLLIPGLAGAADSDFEISDGVLMNYTGPGGNITIPDGVTSIRNYAFSGCNALTGVEIPEGVTSIGDRAFYYCQNLTFVTLPSTLESLGDGVFEDCSSLSSIEDRSGRFLKVVDGIIYSIDGTRIISVTSASGEVHIAEGVTELPERLFDSNSRITSVVIPEGVTKIGDRAFNYCDNLTSVTLPSTLVSLGKNVFTVCRNLATIVDKSGSFLKDVDGIVYSADGTQIIAVLATASGEIRIAEGVTEIPDSLFNGNSRVTSIVIPEGVTSIGSYAFGLCTNLTSVILPSTLQSLPSNVFTSCDKLANIEDKSGKFLKIVDSVVYNAEGTQIIVVLATASGELRLVEGITAIPSSVFNDNDRITSIVIPEGVTRIESYAFSWCRNLVSVEIPEGVISIRSGAFNHCESLTSVTLPSTLEDFGENVFDGCKSLNNLEDKSGKFLKTMNGIVYSADGTKILAVLATASGEIRLAEGITKIPYGLFNSNKQITGIVIPEGVTTIENYAFSYCENLTFIILPSTLENLGENVFNGCEGLTSLEDRSGKFLKTVDGIVYSADGAKILAVLATASGEIRLAEGITEIPYGLFNSNKQITGIVIPEGVTTIENYAFGWCENLTSVTLPSTLENLGESAFNGCDNLISIEDKSGKFLKTVDGIVYSADGAKIFTVLATASGEIHIAEGVTEIPYGLFSGNSRVTNIVIPEGVTKIGDYAFSSCKNLTSVTLPSTLQSLPSNAFNGCDKLDSIVDKSGKFMKVVDGIVYSADGTQILALLASVSGNIRIAEGVTVIPYGPFNSNDRITGVVIPEGVTIIEDWAFTYCQNLTSVTLPSTLESVGSSAFRSCDNLINIENKSGKFIKIAEGILYYYSADETQILAVLPSASGNIHIIDGVTEISGWQFNANRRITGIVIPEGVTRIGDGAFSYCTNLASVTLPSTLVSLGEMVFEGCDNLTSIEDKSGKFLKTIDGIIYYYGAEGTQILAVLATAPSDIRIAEGVTEIPASLFNGNDRITSIVIPEGVTKIGDSAFSWCYNLTSVTLPSTLTTFGKSVFRGCSSLISLEDRSGKFLKVVDGVVYNASETELLAVLATASGEIRIAEGVTVIPDSLFSNSSQITSVVIPEGVTRIEDYAFSSCDNLTSVTLPSTLETLGDCVFEGCDSLSSIVDKSGKFIKTVDGIVYSMNGTRIIAVLSSVSGEVRIAEGVTEIPAWLFGFNDRITSVVIPEGVTSIGYCAFRGCGNLTSVTLPSTLEILEDSVFEECDKLTNVVDKSGKFLKIVDGIVYTADGTRILAVLTSASGEIHIAEGVTEIPDSLFNNNDRITGIVVPEGVIRIGYSAFSSCHHLTSVTLPSTLAVLEEDVFENCDNLASIVDKSGKCLKIVDGIVYNADVTQILVVLTSASGEIRIAEGVTEIPIWRFTYNDRITGIVIPEGVTNIGDYAFFWCENLTSITLPSTLKTIGYRAFDGCSKLTNIVDKSGTMIKTVDGVVYSADGTRIITVLGSASGEIRIAEGVTEIPNALFNSNPRVTCIILPEGITHIGNYAFSWCENLISVTLPSTLETLGNGVFDGCDKLSSIVDKSGKFIKTTDGIVYTADGTRIIAVLTATAGEVRIAEGVKEIPNWLFDNNSLVTSIVIPEGVTQIGNRAFSYCKNLTSVTLPSTLEILGNWVFQGSSSLNSIVNKSGKLLKVVDGIVYSMDGTQILSVTSASGEIRIAEGVKSIPAEAFYENPRITGAIVPEGVVIIDDAAFYGCENLTSITLPSTLTFIGTEAIPTLTIIRSEPGVYAHTWALANGYTWQSTQQAESKIMKLPAGLKTIQQEAFQGSPAECFVLPDGCVGIGERAFADCKELKLVEIPASVIAIADTAFEGCGEGLVIVTPKGSAAERFAQAHDITVTSDEP